MGLAERRAIKAYEDNTYPGLTNKIDTAAGFEVPMEVHWDKIAVAGEADRYGEEFYLTNTYFTVLADALRKVAGDEMGKAALKTGLKKVVITFDPDTAPATNYEAGWPFKDGVLTINYQPGANGHDHEEKFKAIVKNLEAAL